MVENIFGVSGASSKTKKKAISSFCFHIVKSHSLQHNTLKIYKNLQGRISLTTFARKINTRNKQTRKTKRL